MRANAGGDHPLTSGCPGCTAPSPPKDVLVVNGPHDLKAILRPSAEFDDILIRCRFSSCSNADELRSTLLRLHQECGCLAGQVALVIALPLAAGWRAWSWWGGDDHPGHAWAITGAVILLPILAAKWITVFVARLRLRSLVGRTILAEEHCGKA